MYNKVNERRSKLLPHDGRDYYQKYGDDDESGTRDSKSLYFNGNLVDVLCGVFPSCFKAS